MAAPPQEQPLLWILAKVHILGNELPGLHGHIWLLQEVCWQLKQGHGAVTVICPHTDLHASTLISDIQSWIPIIVSPSLIQ